MVKLAGIALEVSTLIEDFSEGFLDSDNMLTNRQLAAQVLLQVGTSRQMVCMDMGFNMPFNLQVALLNIFNNGISDAMADGGRWIVEVEH